MIDGIYKKIYNSFFVKKVLKLADFFGQEDVFFAYGNERVGSDDFELEPEEGKAIRQNKKSVRNGEARNGPKPKMPVKSHNDTFVCVDDELINGSIRADTLPQEIQNQYLLGSLIGDGNFAVVVKLKDKSTSSDFALKVIDKSKCKGKVRIWSLFQFN